MSSFGIYIIGFILIIGGLAYAAMLAGAPQTWIIVGAVIIAGIGLISGAVRTRRKDPADPADTLDR